MMQQINNIPFNVSFILNSYFSIYYVSYPQLASEMQLTRGHERPEEVADDTMNAMLANKYLAEGQTERAVPIFEALAADGAQRVHALYALLVCHAVQLRCRDVSETVHRILTASPVLDTDRIRQYGHRFSAEFIVGLRARLGDLCRHADSRATACNRMVLAELLEDETEAARCRRLIGEMEPEWNIR